MKMRHVAEVLWGKTVFGTSGPRGFHEESHVIGTT